MAYKRLSLEERVKISDLLQQGLSQYNIAFQLKRSTSSIYEEVHRFGSIDNYCPVKAHANAQEKGKLRKKHTILDYNVSLQNKVKELLSCKWSPEQIAGFFKKEGIGNISHETIYRYIYNIEDCKERELWISYLRRKKRRRRRKNLRKNRSSIRNPISIHERPEEVFERQVLGHWEGDLIVGIKHKSAVATLVELTSRFVIVKPIQDGMQAHKICLDVCASMGHLPRIARKSLTWDRGLEMAKHEKITSLLEMPIYFADPYSAWQRGTNENTNGLLREYFPKGTDFRNVTWEAILKASEELNNRPRKTLNYHTPQEVFQWLLLYPEKKLEDFLTR